MMLLPLLCFLGAVMIGADFAAISLAPLKTLQIPYPKFMGYLHLIVPAGCVVLWLISLRWWPNAGSIVAVLLCFWLIGLIEPYAQSRVTKVPVAKFIETSKQESIEQRLGFRIFQHGSSEGTFIIVAPENEQKVREELSSLGLLVHPAGK